MKMPVKSVNHKGDEHVKMKYTPIAAVVGRRVKQDELITEPKGLINPNTPVDQDEVVAEYKGAYLLISNRHDAPQEVLAAWLRRWNIEVLFRTAKQKLGMLDCHSDNENHIHAHLTLMFTAETLIRYLLWEQRKTAGEEDCTHGQVIRNLLCIRCHIRLVARKNEPNSILIDLDTEAKRFATFIYSFWPPFLKLQWCYPANNQLLRVTA